MPQSRVTRSDTSRRKFLQLAGPTAIASTVNASMSAWAQSRPAASARSDSAQAAPRTPPISDEARALAGIVERRYGRHLGPAQLEAVTREIDGRLQGGKRLRETRLANHDEPDFVFHAG